MQKYTVFVIDDEPFMLEIIKEICLLSGLFEITTYEDPKVLLSDISMKSFNNQEMPDLFVVDLELKAKEMQGLELIAELSGRRDFQSAILAISGYVSIGELLEAVEAGPVSAIPKPFSNDFLDQMERCAEIGRNRRTFRGDPSVQDDSRKQRSVFLSYCAKDVKPGNLVRRNLEARGVDVWYAPDALEPGDVWRERIRLGLTQARILVALITQEYIKSPVCKAELTNFLRRMPSEVERPLLLIPVLFEYSPDAAKQDELIRNCLKYQYITMSTERFVDGFTAIYWRIKNFLLRDP